MTLSDIDLIKINSQCIFCSEEAIATSDITSVGIVIALTTILLFFVAFPVTTALIVIKFKIYKWSAESFFSSLKNRKGSSLSRSILRQLQIYRSVVLKNGVYAELSTLSLTQDELRRFVLMRCKKAESFIQLLAAIETEATRLKEWDIKKSVRSNMSEEIGMTSSGTVDPLLNHQTWKHWWLNGIGAQSAMSKKQSKTVGRFKDYLDKIIEQKNLMDMSLVLTLLEGSISHEFRLLLNACKDSFPEEMSDPKTQMYLLDHIHHDPRHYKEIVNAIVDSKMLRVNLCKYEEDVEKIGKEFIEENMFFSTESLADIKK